MTDVLVKKKTLANQISLKIKENQKVNQRGDSIRKKFFQIWNLFDPKKNPICGEI